MVFGWFWTRVRGQLFRGCPCALRTPDDRPVSVWHAGAGDTLSLEIEKLREWSKEVFEYADLWVTKDSKPVQNH